MIGWVRRLVRGDDGGPSASEAALERAREARAEAEARRPVVLAVAELLRHAREENHFRERIEAAFRGAPR
ncbi:DUF7620 family protein [Streptomyces sp. bgisy154]|uniref:DUF7620 family protein n=1 Tax=Streptomyces sp. bgisy154 TaxID=3413794 RepID=UPI003D761F73